MIAGELDTKAEIQSLIVDLAGEMYSNTSLNPAAYVVQFSGIRKEGYTIDDQTVVLKTQANNTDLHSVSDVAEAVSGYSVSGETPIISG